jgi:ABC-type lipoprotein release transport system permease subunit
LFQFVLGLSVCPLARRHFIAYQASPRDPLVLAGVVVAMPFLGLLATWIPARHALSIDPLTVLLRMTSQPATV